MKEQKVASHGVVGKVVSTNMKNTVIVEIERVVQHPLYRKYLRRYSRMPAHDEGNVSKKGDTVLIKQCRPLSKTKHWILVSVLEQAVQEVTENI